MRIIRILLAAVSLAALQTTVVAAERFSYGHLDISYFDNGLDGLQTAIEGVDTVDVLTGSGDGIDVFLSLAVSENIHLFAEYAESNLDLDVTQSVPFPGLSDVRSSFFSTSSDAIWNPRNDLDGDAKLNFRDLAVLARAETAIRARRHVSVGGDLSRFRFGVGLHRTLAPNWGLYGRVFAESQRLDHGTVTLFDGNRDFGARDDGIGAAVGLRIKATDLLELEASVTYSPVGEINVLGLDDAQRFADQALVGLEARCVVSKRLGVTANVRGDGDIRIWGVGFRVTFGAGHAFRPVYGKSAGAVGLPCM